MDENGDKKASFPQGLESSNLKQPFESGYVWVSGTSAVFLGIYVQIGIFHWKLLPANFVPLVPGTPAIGLLALIPSHGFAWPKRGSV